MADARTVGAASATMASAWGPVVVVATPRGVLAVELRGSAAAVRSLLRRRLGADVALLEPTAAGEAGRVLRGVLAALRATLQGERVPLDEVPLDWTGVAAWDRRVLEGARTIGRGQVTSYGRLARRIGAPGAARAVGAAMGRNPFWLLVPCHRVVAGDGSIGGYGDDPDGPEIKRDLLALEGIALPVADLTD
ncbi:MAG TPA: methylated-DNA--[protein]-cysteine S-methyltransferase [Candidatus Sulfotelmatobacter sp.]|nr:methylated-DNA--[protein]-cysteine S-methyltransferase [Candidatus Sulfotelmatobacter sp.]